MRNSHATYKIRQVIDLTGASEFLLRVWENRYSAFTPARTKTGRRLYSEDDVLRARALLALTRQGLRVSDIAKLSLTELNNLLIQGAVEKIAIEVDPSVKKIMTKANQFSWHEVRTLIIQEKKNRKPLNWVHNLIVPLLLEISRQVDAGHLSIAQEHILSAIIKESLAINTHRQPPTKSRLRIVLAAPEGDYHDIGLLIASQIANELRANTLFLGPHMPKSELASVCVRYNATHLLLSSTADKESGTKDDYLKYIHFLDRNINSKITLWLAGRNAQKHSASLARPYKIIDSFYSFEEEVKKCLK